MQLLARHPLTSEDVAKEKFAPLLSYSLNCFAAMISIDMFLWYNPTTFITNNSGVYATLLGRYYTLPQSKHDPQWVRLIVVAMAAMSFGISAYTNYYVSYHVNHNWGKYIHFFETQLLYWFPFVDALAAALAQGFFAYRAFKMNNRNWAVLISIWTLILGGIGTAMATLIVSRDLTVSGHGVDHQQLVTGCMRATLLTTLLANTIITGSIIWALYRTRTTNHTETLLSRTTRMVMESQLPPFLITLAFTIQYNVSFTSLLCATFLGIQGKFYAICLMYTLNLRAPLGGVPATGNGNGCSLHPTVEPKDSTTGLTKPTNDSGTQSSKASAILGI